ncbi:SDR family oxidoreductase [Flavobacterium microcysteis]|uniref:SDR family NAD(P)-dependent oxidoreductase n=1 Tax=Flavobacterium microcysteis TaxID=2596891 RepID=A0A501QFN7_9FLAO|nr:SDR family NAD(P)-dependent oxidoreductase [Flavobacterium microcysteis]TPD71192.1 SDR family NAD(P)-dependent oxidoreductase [Flavobacterium microcysteis]
MKTSKNTILITGGGSGIGYEFAKIFSQNDNQVIITGRNEEKLNKAAASLKNTTAIAADITKEEDIDRLAQIIAKEYPNLNVLINNAGNASYYDVLELNTDAFAKASDEINTNYLSIVRLTEKLLPVLNSQKESAIVNVSSIVALVPSKTLITYSASKAALHSYTQSLRIALDRSTYATQVYEIMPPLVNTDFSKEIGGENGISPEIVAQDLLRAFEENQYEIHVGQTSYIYELSLSSPKDALLTMNSQS